MRKVKIISSADIPKMMVGAKDYEEPLNEAFSNIEKEGGNILKTEYCISRTGLLEAVIIEFEVG